MTDAREDASRPPAPAAPGPGAQDGQAETVALAPLGHAPAAAARTTAVLPAAPSSAAAPPPADAVDAAGAAGHPATLVIEDGVIPRRLRRPLDLARLVTAVAGAAGVVLLSYFATSTTSGIDQDIAQGANRLPDVLRLAVNLVGSLGVLGLPLAAAVDMVVRRRARQLFESIGALLVTVSVLTAVDALLTAHGNPRLVVALAGGLAPSSTPTSPTLGGLVAFVTVAGLVSRPRWNVLTALVVGSLVALAVLGGGIATAGIGLSVLLGWTLGLVVRYALGTPTTRPSGVEVAAALDRGGLPVTVLRASQTTDVGRRYVATTRRGGVLEVTVLDRDLEGAGLVSAAWRTVRLRREAMSSAFNMRRTLEHSALMAYAAQAAGAPAPRLLLASEVGPDSALLAHERIEGRRFADLGDSLTDDDLLGAWRALRTLREHRLAHRSLTSDHLVRDPQGQVWLIGLSTGSVAAGDVVERLDVAELLCSLALLADAERALRTGRRVLGVEALTRALPVLQPVALSAPTRAAMRRRRDLMVRLRDLLVEMRPEGETEQIELERVKPRTLVMIVLGTVAAYVLLGQLSQADLGAVLGQASWGWAAVAALASVVTYLGASLSLSGFVPERLSLWRTTLAQLAGDFATLVSPPTLGAVAINLRFLQKAGLHPALAAASVGVSQVAAFVAHVVLLLGFGVLAGRQTDFSFDPPRSVIVAVVVVAVLLACLAALAPVRRAVLKRVRPLLREVVPRMVTVAQRPAKIIEGFGGIILLNVAYVVVLIACVRAFGGPAGFASIAVVYLAGSVIGQAAPTPGGLGAVEATLTAGLGAVGVDLGVAVSAVLLFRLFTFWIPTVPGYVAFTWLQRNNYL